MKKIIFIFLILFSLTGCTSKIVYMAFKKVGMLDQSATLKTLSYKDKKIIFLEMVHLGKVEFYNDVKFKVDSLQKEGFFVFYEGAYLRRSDKIIKENDTIYCLKFRKLTNIDPLVEYSKTKPFSEYISKYNLIDQPDYTDLGLIRENSKSVDLPISILIGEFEKQKGEVVLNECDYKTKLGSEGYNCGKIDTEQRNSFFKEIIEHKREQNIIDQIKASNKNKILLIYGKKHYDALKKKLEA